MIVNDLIKDINSGIKLEDEKMMNNLKTIKEDEEGSTVIFLEKIYPDLLYDATRCLLNREPIEEFMKVIKFLEIDPSVLTSYEVFKSCLTSNNNEFVDIFLDNGYTFTGGGNLVRKAVYSNKLNIANVLIKHGCVAPSVVTLYNVCNNLSWDAERIKFLLDRGTKIEINAKELSAIDIMGKYSSTNFIFTRDAMLLYMKSHPTKMTHAFMVDSSYFISDGNGKITLADTLITYEECYEASELLSDKKYDTGWYNI